MQHPETPALTALAYDLVDGGERERLLEHLAQCDTCRTLYDGYRDEQSLVREAIIRDARSGPAEAKALERTLVMLGAAEAVEAKPAGRLLRVPIWIVATQAAALLVVAVGLFLVLKPDAPAPWPVVSQPSPVAAHSGEVLMPSADGEWQRADSVQANVWHKAGDTSVSMTLDDGSKVEVDQGGMFMLAWSADNAPVFRVFSGTSRVQTNDYPRVTVQAGEANLQALGGSYFEVLCEAPDGKWKLSPVWLSSYAQAATVKAKIQHGDLLASALNPAYTQAPLVSGDSFFWTRNSISIRDASGGEVPTSPVQMLLQHKHDGEVALEWASRYQDRIDGMRKRMDQLRREMQAHAQHLKHPDEVQRARATLAELERFVHFERMAPTLNLQIRGGDTLLLHYMGKQFEADSPEELKQLVPPPVWETLSSSYNLERTSQGWQVKEVGGTKVRVRAVSSSGASSDGASSSGTSSGGSATGHPPQPTSDR